MIFATTARLFVLAGCLSLFMSATARAWDSEGHEIVATIANSELNPKAKAQVAELARELPTSGKTYDSITAACWMDDIRFDRNNPDYGLFKSWHYIDLPIDSRDPAPSFVPGSDNEEHGDVVQALKRAVVVLKGGTDPYITSKAVACALVMHLVGDIHQPLHCATKYFFSHHELRNDFGGNEEYISNAAPEAISANLPPGAHVPEHLSLHFFWDTAYRADFDNSSGDVFFNRHAELADFRDLAANGSLDPNFDEWATDSNAIARDFVYRELTPTENPKYSRLSSAYVEKARAISRAQLVLAGHRLAALLNSTLGADNPGPPPPPYAAGAP
jgi:hypothetical protein